MKEKSALKQEDVESSKSQEVVQRCVAKMGKTPEYNLLINNCEHVVRNCVSPHGGHSTNQVSFFWKHVKPQLLAHMSELWFVNDW